MDIQWISAYFCPTKILFVDDDQSYIGLLTPQLDIEFPLYELYDDPAEAFKYLNENYKPYDFLEHIVLAPEGKKINRKRFDIDIQKIFMAIYNPARFSDISVLVTDLNMPNHTGEELCKKLQGKLKSKKLMITSESQEKLAIELLNRRIIDQFIQKALSGIEQSAFIQSLSEAIQELRQDYFYDQSEMIITRVLTEDDASPAPLRDPEFIEIFNQILSKNKLCEYYLIDSSGSFLFLSSDGKPSYLLVRTKDNIQTASELIEDADFKVPGVLESIQKKEKILYWNKEEDFPKNEQDLLAKLYPAQKAENFYYCYVDDQDILQLDQSKIVSFNQFCLDEGYVGH